MGKKVVLDTNILISALGWKGPPHTILTKLLNKDFEMIISNKQLKELQKVLNYPKFSFSEQQKSRFLTIITESATVVDTITTVGIIKEDPSDNILLEIALENDVQTIVSGDEHLLKLRNFAGAKILTATEFLNSLTNT